MGELLIKVDHLTLTQNLNIFSQTIEESVLVSLEPLAMWLMQSWWRLLYEPLQSYSPGKLDIEWRMAHEIGAVGNGYVWPRIAFVSDLENIYIHAKPTRNELQSVRYINGTEGAFYVSVGEFKQIITNLIHQVINRLDGLKEEDTTLKEFWNVILEEERDQEAALYRKVEAMLGYNPDEADAEVMKYAIAKHQLIGEHSLGELAPVYGRMSGKSFLDVNEFFETAGILGKPQISLGSNGTINARQPWKRANEDARTFRDKAGIDPLKPIETTELFDLLGVASTDQKKWMEPGKARNASVGLTNQLDDQVMYLPRKTNIYDGRFEMARFLGDYLGMGNREWLVGADTTTVRQKYQRAFAAELLCPIEALRCFMDGNFSADCQEDAAKHFKVGERLISTVLANAGEIEFPFASDESYRW